MLSVLSEATPKLGAWWLTRSSPIGATHLASCTNGPELRGTRYATSNVDAHDVHVMPCSRFHDLLGAQIGPGRRHLTAAQVDEVRAAARTWRDDHLRTAWPILVPQLDRETVESHALRVRAELSAARALRDRLDREAEGPGDSIGVVSQEQMDIGVRAAVLKNQYNELCERLRRSSAGDIRSAGAQWIVEGYGDSLDEDIAELLAVPAELNALREGGLGLASESSSESSSLSA